jgi:hypothetical protein
MIFTLTSGTIIMAKMAFFWPSVVAGESQEEHDKRTEDFLVKDEFKNETILDVENSFLLKVLEKLKDEYRTNYYGTLEKITFKTMTYSYAQLDRVFRSNRIQIMRLRLVIEPDSIVSINKTFNREQKYSVMRGYWVNDAGKKILKFSVSLGNTENVMSSGKYDHHAIKIAEKEIRTKLLETYVQTYGEIKL